jgi:AcrR family transcriptional regulator
MVRYSKGQKQETRQRIIDAAGRRLKSDGIDGSGVAKLMADAGLTNGAFYAHFASKDDLVAAVIAEQLRTQRESLDTVDPGDDGIGQFLRWYLSAEHRDNREDGCPSAALLDEIGRSPEVTRQAYTDGVLAIADDMAVRLTPHEPQSARVHALGVFAMVIGTVQLSRALTDQELADAVLRQGIENVALTALAIGQQNESV